MAQGSQTAYHLAIDICPTGGRHVLGHVEGGHVITEEMYRFEHAPIRFHRHDCWDIDGLFRDVLRGLIICAQAGKAPATVAIDAWGRDFVLVDAEGGLIGDAVTGDDARTEGVRQRVSIQIPPEELYRTTGVRMDDAHALFQLIALAAEHPDQLEAADRFLMIPDYFCYLLTGVAANERTGAATTGMLDVRTGDWDCGLLGIAGIPQGIFAKPEVPGTMLGGFAPSIAEAVGFDAKVMLTASSRSACALLSTPVYEEDEVCLAIGRDSSSLGAVLEGAVTTEGARLRGFTNAIAQRGMIGFAVQLPGMQMLQAICDEFNGAAGADGVPSAHVLRKSDEPRIVLDDFAGAAKEARGFTSCVDLSDKRFIAPASAIDELRDACRESAQAVPNTPGEVMQCAYRSLACACARAVGELSALTGRSYRSIGMVGEGADDAYLVQTLADICAMPVTTGPRDAEGLGNLSVQFIAGEEVYDARAAREALQRSFPTLSAKPQEVR